MTDFYKPFHFTNQEKNVQQKLNITHDTIAEYINGRNAGTTAWDGIKVTLAVYANNAAAVTGGLAVGQFYRNGADPDLVCVVH